VPLQNQPQIKDYQIHLPPLGEGAFGRVYHATYRGISDRAVKIFKPDTVDLPTMSRELEKLSLMAEHPGIVTLHDFDLVAETPYYAMSLHADSGSDGTWSSRTLENLCGKVDAKEAAELIDQIVDAMAYLHRHQVLHCDLKPSNVMITDERPPRIKICDFGQSRGAARNTPDAVGTPLYSSPEQLLKPDESSDGAGFKWDVYSFGVLAYKLVTGRLPRLQQLLSGSGGSGTAGEFELSILDETRHEASIGDSSSMTRSGRVAEQLFEEEEVEWPAGAPIDNRRKAIITQCISLDRSDRPADMREVHDEIERSLNERKVTRQRNWTLLFAAMMMIAILATIVAGVEAYQSRQANRGEQQARQGAEELVRFILTDLRQKLDADQQVELLEHIVENADTYVNSLPTDRQTEDTIRTIASALHTKAAYALGRGDAELAAESFGQLIAIYDRILESAETTGRIQFARAEAKVGMGDALRAQGKLTDALDFYEAALLSRDVENPDGAPPAIYLRNTANAHTKVGRVLTQLEDFDDAIERFGVAVRIHRLLQSKLDSTHPNADGWRILASVNDLADANRLGGNDETAEELYREVIDEASEGGLAYGRKVPAAHALHQLGEIYLESDRPFEARKLFEKEHVYREDLHRIERSNPMRSLELAHCLSRLVECYDLDYGAERGLAKSNMNRAIDLAATLSKHSRFEETALELKTEFEAKLKVIVDRDL
jgi:tetratricopeptide (TPR) repeat protein